MLFKLKLFSIFRQFLFSFLPFWHFKGSKLLANTQLGIENRHENMRSLARNFYSFGRKQLLVKSREFDRRIEFLEALQQRRMLVAEQLQRGNFLSQLDADVVRRFRFHQLDLQRRVDSIVQFVNDHRILDSRPLWNQTTKQCVWTSANYRSPANTADRELLLTTKYQFKKARGYVPHQQIKCQKQTSNMITH